MRNISIKTSKSLSINTKLPPELGDILKDDNKNGLPDIIEEKINGENRTEIEVNGVRYKSWDEVPEKDKWFLKLFNPKDFIYKLGGKQTGGHLVEQNKSVIDQRKDAGKKSVTLLGDKLVWVIIIGLIIYIGLKIWKTW
ncbi:MAG: hypothetical protein WC686_05235 [Candidatus Shapirobacteria bacterium]|jgi:hypothetical protein